MNQETIKKNLGIFNKVIVNFLSSKQFLLITFVWFFLQALYIALDVKSGIPPDEIYHTSFINLFTHNGWLPFVHNQSSYYFLGEIQKTPFFLYNYLLSIPNHIFIGSEHALTILRLLNIPLGIGSLYITYLIAKQIKVSALARNLALFMLSNTLMFLFISASVNYDNLFIFLSLCSVLLLLKQLYRPSLQTLLLLAISIMSGLLVKVSFLPIALIIVVILLKSQVWRKNRKGIINYLVKDFRSARYYSLFLIIIAFGVFALFSQRYFANTLEYKTYSPKCTQVLTLEQCRQNGVFARDEKLHASPLGPANESSYQYLAEWTFLMQDRTYGIFGHKSADALGPIVLWMQIFIVIGLVAISKKFRLRDKNMGILLLISGFYSLVLILENHSIYEKTGVIGLAVQGRYIFPVLPLLYLVFFHYIFKLIKTRIYLSCCFIILTVGVSLSSGIFSYIYITTPDWHNQKSASISDDAKSILERTIP